MTRCREVAVSKMMTTYPFHSKENDMKKAILVVVANMLLIGSAVACQTQTLVVGGKLQVCTICGSVVSCM
jgi:hypothetical protein